MLLGYRSGIAEWDTPDIDQQIAQDRGHIWTLTEILDLGAKTGPAFEPGAQYGYSNTNYEYMPETRTYLTGFINQQGGLGDVLVPAFERLSER